MEGRKNVAGEGSLAEWFKPRSDYYKELQGRGLFVRPLARTNITTQIRLVSAGCVHPTHVAVTKVRHSTVLRDENFFDERP